VTTTTIANQTGCGPIKGLYNDTVRDDDKDAVTAMDRLCAATHALLHLGQQVYPGACLFSGFVNERYPVIPEGIDVIFPLGELAKLEVETTPPHLRMKAHGQLRHAEQHAQHLGTPGQAV
jgi:hypothetical protein